MSDSDTAKAAKKAAKARAKAEKKRAKVEGSETMPAAKAVAAEPSKESLGHRSAAAAERQVRLQSYRVWIALLTLLVALLAFLFAVRPWNAVPWGGAPADATRPAQSDD